MQLSDTHLTYESITPAVPPDAEALRKPEMLFAGCRANNLPIFLIGPEADAVLSTYRVLASHRARFGPDGLGALIVSMTRDLSDLLSVYLFAREAGLTDAMDLDVFQASDGRFLVPAWHAAEDLMQGDAVEVTLAFGSRKRAVSVYSPLDGAEPVETLTDVTELVLKLPPGVVVIEVRP